MKKVVKSLTEAIGILCLLTITYEEITAFSEKMDSMSEDEICQFFLDEYDFLTPEEAEELTALIMLDRTSPEPLTGKDLLELSEAKAQENSILKIAIEYAGAVFSNPAIVILGLFL